MYIFMAARFSNIHETAHTARVVQQSLHANCPQMIEKEQWRRAGRQSR